MNLLPKTNLWVVKSVQVMRTFRITGPKWSTDSGETISCRPPVDSGKKPVGSKEDIIQNMAFTVPHALPQAHTRLSASEGNPGMPIADLPASEGNPGMPNDAKIDAGKKAGEFLNRFYGDQVKYFQKIAKVNRVAMKRIKKLRKEWLKFVENNF